MQSRVYTEDELDEWREWFDRLDSPGPYHTPEYISLLAGEFEYDSERAEAFVYGSEDAFVYYPYIRRSLDDLPFADNAVEDPSQYSDIVSSWYYGGPLLSNGADSSIAGDSLQAFTEFCATEGIISEFIRFDPNRCNHEIFSELEPMFNRETVYVDFSKDEETLWDEFEKRNRNAIRQAKETDLVIEPTRDPDEFEAFYEIYTNAMEAKDAFSHYRFPLSFFEKLFATDFATLTVARYGDEIVGGAVVVHENGIAHDYLRASDPDYWDMRVNNLLCYETMMGMRERGFKRFDFQGGRPGVFKFKKGFSTEDRGEFYIAKQTHLPDIYDQLKAAANDFGIDVSTGYFPAYRREKSN